MRTLHKNTIMIGATAVLTWMLAIPVFAQGMMGWYGNTTSADAQQIASEEAEGKAIWEKLQAKQVTCADIKEDDFELLGDYFMGLMMGTSHASMDAAMQSRIGEAGNRQIHIAMGKRLSGCDASAAYPQSAAGYFPMMGGSFGGMMGWGGYGNYGWASGASWWPFGLACMITIGLVWTALILGIIALLTWISKQKK